MSAAGKFDDVTLLALELAARRAELDGGAFVELLKRYTRAVVAEVETRSAPTPDEPQPDQSAPSAAEHPPTEAPQAAAEKELGRMTHAQLRDLIAQYRAARANGSRIPKNWINERADELGVPYAHVYRAIYPIKVEIDEAAEKERRRVPTAPQSERFKVRRMHGTYGGGE